MKIHSQAKLIIPHLNINSIRNKFDSVSFIIEKIVDILLISETKLNDSYLSSQFKIFRFSMPYWYGGDSMVRRLLLHVRHDVPGKLLKHDFGAKM